MSLLKDIHELRSPNFPVEPAEATQRCLLILCAHLTRSGKLTGHAIHCLFRKLIPLGLHPDKDLRPWMLDLFGKSLSQRAWDHCRTVSDNWLAEGIQVAELPDLGRETPLPESRRPLIPSATNRKEPSGEKTARPPCPSVLFFKGEMPGRFPLLAFFNSRKPRPISPDTLWLQALRFLLRELEGETIAIAASTGTLTYDLAAAHAIRAGIPLKLIVPYSILMPGTERAALYEKAASGVFSCLPATSSCPKAQRLVCRDRLLASLSQIHAIIVLRRGGNLISILKDGQTLSSGPRLIFDSGKRTPDNEGNYILLERFPARSRVFTLPELPASGRTKPTSPASAADVSIPPPYGQTALTAGQPEPEAAFHARVDWDRFLFHFTRACPGPWPGQNEADYHRSILDNDPFCGHTALDTLTKILEELRIRAGFGLIRGTDPVISFSSMGPPRFRALRRWNASRARWTVEPYGIAISRKIMRQLGAKPAVYGREKVYELLPETERFRFQSDPSGHPEWRHEREWRILGDLEIDKLPAGTWFAFVPRYVIKLELMAIIGQWLPVMACDTLAECEDSTYGAF